MKKDKFVQDAKLDPSRYYRNPSDIVRDRRLTNSDRLEILDAWERDARERQENEDIGGAEADRLQQFRRVREELERSAEALGDASLGFRRAEDQA